MENPMQECPFIFSSRPDCIIFNTYRWSNLEAFIFDKKQRDIVDGLMIANKIDCIIYNSPEKSISIKNEKCINCMYCLFGCPGHLIEVRNNFSLSAKCSQYNEKYDDKLSDEIYNSFFDGKIIDFPSLSLSHMNIVYKNFEEFTKVNETTNIAVWTANTIKHLSSSETSRIGLEINMIISERDRGGRLDVCMINSNNLIVLETKVSFNKMVTEARYTSQMSAYEEEITNILKKNNIAIHSYKSLIVGGPERDLLPFTHSECTSKVGNQSEMFYNNLLKFKFPFISAQSLLLLGLLKLFKGPEYSIENIFSIINKKGFLGLLSCGFVGVKNGQYHIFKLKDSI